MKGGCIFTPVFDSESSRDRIKWTLPVPEQNMTYLGVIEKNYEYDYQSTMSDGDYDAYYGIGIYKKENITAGLLLAATRLADSTGAFTRTQQVIIPHADVKINDTYGVKAELYLRPGELDYSEASEALGLVDTDLMGTGLYLAGTGNFGKTKAEVGLAYASGDDEGTTDEDESLRGSNGLPNTGLGDEWTPFVVLQDVNALLGSTDDGVMLFYAQADYALSENMTVTGLIGMANADEVAAGAEDDYGIEIDAKLEWKLTDVLTYNFSLGYLMAGDYFKDATVAAATGTDAEDTFTLFHKLQLDF
jgi:hypothetical protein